MIHIVMPMGGEGKRFAERGYTFPKPLVEIAGKPMVEIVVHNLTPSEPHRFIFICRQEHLQKFALGEVLNLIAPENRVISMRSPTSGALCSVLLGMEYLQNDDELLVANADQFVDVLENNKVYMPSLLVFNKADLISEKEQERLQREYRPELMISAIEKTHVAELKEAIYRKLDLISVFLKEPGKEADLKVPLIMFRNCTIRDVCSKLHKDFVKKFKFSRVWGKSAKFGGQRLMLKHVLIDNDILELHIR